MTRIATPWNSAVRFQPSSPYRCIKLPSGRHLPVPDYLARFSLPSGDPRVVAPVQEPRPAYEDSWLGAGHQKTRDIIREISRPFRFDDQTIKRRMPRVCANEQAPWTESCACAPEQVARCVETLKLAQYWDEINEHFRQVKFLHGAITDVTDSLFAETPTWPRSEVVVNEAQTKYGAVTRRLLIKRATWRQGSFRAPWTKLLPEKDIGLAFVTMLYAADDTDDAFCRQRPRNLQVFCDAPTLSARAYQAANVVLTAYYDCQHIGVPVADIAAAKIVAEVFESCLFPPKPRGNPDSVDDGFLLLYRLDKSTDLGRSGRDVGRIFRLDEAAIRRRVDRRLEIVESRLGKYCKSHNGLAYGPQSAQRACYNIYESWEKRADRLVVPRELERPYPETKKTQTRIAAISPSCGTVDRTDRGAGPPFPKPSPDAELRALAWAQCYFRQQAAVLGYGTFAKVCAPGLAQHYPTPLHRSWMPEPTPVHLAPDERVYPLQPYGTEPLVILCPLPAHAFDKDEPSANNRLGGVVGHESEQRIVMGGTEEPAGPAWSGKIKRRPRGDEDDFERPRTSTKKPAS